MTGLLAAWGVEAGIVTYRSFRTQQRPPLPSDFVATFILFGTLGLVAESPTLAPAATLVGWGVVLATVLNLGPFEAGAIAGGQSLSSTNSPSSPTSAPPTRVGRPV